MSGTTTDWVSLIGTVGIPVIIATITALYILARNARKDINYKIDSIRIELKEDMKEYRKEIEKVDKRWISLFEKFHMLDKDVEVLKSSHKKIRSV